MKQLRTRFRSAHVEGKAELSRGSAGSRGPRPRIAESFLYGALRLAAITAVLLAASLVMLIAHLLKGMMTVYLILPPDRMRAQSPLLRLWIGSMLRAVVKGGLQSQRRVHFVLDEAASLGHMDVLDDAVDKFRGYGVRLLFLYQSLGQLRTCFPEGQEQTLLSNVTQVYFGVNDQQTAEYVSSRLGETTIITESGGANQGTSRQHDVADKGPTHSRGSSQNWQYMGRRLLKPEEVTALPERVAITFTPGTPPLATRLVRYYEKDFKRLDGIGPVRTALRIACLFLWVVFFAVMVAAMALNQGIQSG